MMSQRVSHKTVIVSQESRPTMTADPIDRSIDRSDDEGLDPPLFPAAAPRRTRSYGRQEANQQSTQQQQLQRWLAVLPCPCYRSYCCCCPCRNRHLNHAAGQAIVGGGRKGARGLQESVRCCAFLVEEKEESACFGGWSCSVVVTGGGSPPRKLNLLRCPAALEIFVLL